MTSWIKTGNVKKYLRHIPSRENQSMSPMDNTIGIACDPSRIETNHITHLHTKNPIVNHRYTPKKPFEPHLFTQHNSNRIRETITTFSRQSLQHVKRIVNIYTPYYKNNLPAAGFGDFLRGCYYLYQYCKLANKEFDIGCYNHPLSDIVTSEVLHTDDTKLKNIIKCSVYNYYYAPTGPTDQMPYISVVNEINEYLLHHTPDDDGTLYVCVMAYPLFMIQTDAREFIKNWLSCRNQNVLDRLQHTYDIINLHPNTYHVIHIRTGDAYLFQQKNSLYQFDRMNQIISLVQKYMDTSKKYILMSDSYESKYTIKSRIEELIVLDIRATHFGENQMVSLDQTIQNMIEFYIMSNALSIYSISCYHHGSGFSKWCAETYEIPYDSIFLDVI